MVGQHQQQTNGLRDRLSSQISSFFHQHGSHLTQAEFFVARTDGILLYADPTSPNTNNSVGALAVSGWHACFNLAQLVHTESRPDDMLFRLSFDTSSSGTYILPFQIKHEEFFLIATYKNSVMPGQLKNQLRWLVEKLKNFLHDLSLLQHAPAAMPTLHDITDADIDRLLMNFN